MIKDCKSIEEAIDLVENILKKTKNNKENLKLPDELLLSNLRHDLDYLINYITSKGRE